MDELKIFDVVLANFSTGNIGSEQQGIHPYIIIQNNTGNKYSPTVIGMSLTSVLKKGHLPTHCIIKKTKANGLNKDSMLLGETLTQMSKERIVRRIGNVNDAKTQREIINVYMANITGKKKNSIFDTVVNMICKLVRDDAHGETTV
jgi:mRNA interferase MazF